MTLLTINLKAQKLPGFTDLMNIDVNVQAITLTNGNMQSQWSIELPQSGNRLPGSEPVPPLFKDSFNAQPPQQLIDGLRAFFEASAPGLVANLNAKANAAKTT